LLVLAAVAHKLVVAAGQVVIGPLVQLLLRKDIQ
jgi:hypothetical protein